MVPVAAAAVAVRVVPAAPVAETRVEAALGRAHHAATDTGVPADAGGAGGLLAGHYLPFAFPALSFTRSPR